MQNASHYLSRAGYGLVIATLLGCAGSVSTPTPTLTSTNQNLVRLAASGTNQLPALSSDIPFDVTVNGPITLDSLQDDFDVLSWDTFVALNWPVAANGQPDKSKVIGQYGDNATVWQTWKESSDIFLPKGATPSPWGSSRQIPAQCRNVLKPNMRFLQQIGKTPNLLEESVEPFKTGPLIDQNGRYARFEILVNQPMFDYIIANKLFSKQGQANFTNVVFPCGSASNKTVGAIMAKAAWKLLTEEEKNSGRFHVTEALVYTPQSDNPVVAEKCERAFVGLVGFHIVHKTIGAPQWVWSTFEHVDNCPTDGEPVSKPQYNFYNKNTPQAQTNEPPPRPWDPNKIEPPDRRVQVVRKIPISTATKALNARYQAALRTVNPKSVWQNYELVSTQWPTNPANDCDVETSAPVDRIGTPAPQFLGNTTLETYIQGKVPNVSSSCMECHANATTTDAVFSDFTFLLERAQ